MTQELTDIRTCILEGRYNEALMLVDELEGMSKKAILQNIESFLVRMLVLLIKNKISESMNNLWYASIRDSVLKIQGLNLKEDKTSYYIKQNEWDDCMEMAFLDAIFIASGEVLDGRVHPVKLEKMVDKTAVVQAATQLLNLTYEHSSRTIRGVLMEEMSTLPGAEDWK
ncbi:MAG: hypothetical protein GDA56_00175 [Hormoscilla sp. GM7CHS1pb]|nr:hypothetical protein [Hormoscilla sp. GM7CHS1pb]